MIRECFGAFFAAVFCNAWIGVCLGKKCGIFLNCYENNN